MTRPRVTRKRFGQHFLESPDTIDRILGTICARQGETVVEIGPGRGAITAGLAGSGALVHAIEFDRDLVPWLRGEYADRQNVRVHEADALAFDYASLGRALRVVGNLPYNISTPLLFRLAGYLDVLQDMHFMLQKEVVDRITASPGSGAFGRLTIMLGCRLHSEALFDVPASAFRPPPKVTSSFVRLWPRAATDAFRILDQELMSRLVARAFSQRRKTLRNALKGTADPVAFDAAGIDPGSRAEEVPVAAWVQLANHLAVLTAPPLPNSR